MNTAVALAIFNRPELARRVMNAIAAAKPPKLFVFADGPRGPADVEACDSTRAVVDDILTTSPWGAEVHIDYAAVNLGCKRRLHSGIDWVFSQVEEAVILEDDCLPDPTFFTFCDQMLERYRGDDRVMMVTGSNYLGRWKAEQQSYHFSLLGSVWGWASWRRAWAHYDVEMTAWPDPAVRAKVQDIVADDYVFGRQSSRFDRLYAAKDGHSWDPPWILSRLIRSGLTVVPAVNLVTNLGNVDNLDGRGLPDAHPLTQLTASSLQGPFTGPSQVAPDRGYDHAHVREIYDWWDHQPAKPLRRSRSTDSRRRPFTRVGASKPLPERES